MRRLVGSLKSIGAFNTIYVLSSSQKEKIWGELEQVFTCRMPLPLHNQEISHRSTYIQHSFQSAKQSTIDVTQPIMAAMSATPLYYTHYVVLQYYIDV